MQCTEQSHFASGLAVTTVCNNVNFFYHVLHNFVNVCMGATACPSLRAVGKTTEAKNSVISDQRSIWWNRCISNSTKAACSACFVFKSSFVHFSSQWSFVGLWVLQKHRQPTVLRLQTAVCRATFSKRVQLILNRLIKCWLWTVDGTHYFTWQRSLKEEHKCR